MPQQEGETRLWALVLSSVVSMLLSYLHTDSPGYTWDLTTVLSLSAGLYGPTKLLDSVDCAPGSYQVSTLSNLKCYVEKDYPKFPSEILFRKSFAGVISIMVQN